MYEACCFVEATTTISHDVIMVMNWLASSGKIGNLVSGMYCSASHVLITYAAHCTKPDILQEVTPCPDVCAVKN